MDRGEDQQHRRPPFAEEAEDPGEDHQPEADRGAQRDHPTGTSDFAGARAKPPLPQAHRDPAPQQVDDLGGMGPAAALGGAGEEDREDLLLVAFPEAPRVEGEQPSVAALE